jgi:hypothetical protein
MAAKELGRFFVGAETERSFAGLAGRRIGAVERGSCWRRSGAPAPRTFCQGTGRDGGSRTASAMLRESVRLPERKKRVVLGIVREFGEAR